MPVKITLVPDLYYRNWVEGADSGPGELWLCLRPFVSGTIDPDAPAGLDEFLAWASLSEKSFDGETARFEYETVNTDPSCGPDGDSDLLPVNLPDDVDLVVTIGGSADGPIRIDRSSGCRVIKKDGSRDPMDLFEEHPATNSGMPFPTAFNDELRAGLRGERTEPGTPVDKFSVAFAISQMLDFGRRYHWTDEQVHGLWDKGLIPELGGVPDKHVTGIYWLLGLMIPLGRQDDLDAIHKIHSIDVDLVAGGKIVGEVTYPEAGPGIPNLNSYFRRIGDNFERKLESEIVDLGVPGRLGREHITYVQPGYHALAHGGQFSAQIPIWRMEEPGAVRNDDGGAARRMPRGEAGANSTIKHGFELKRLAGIEIRPLQKTVSGEAPRAGPLPANASSLKITPGLAIEGTLSLYRRFPDVAAEGENKALLQTVLLFEPEPSAAVALEAMSARLSDAGFRSLFNAALSAAGEANWTLTLLHHGILPWDGPRTQYRLLAIPQGGAAVPEGGSRMYPGRKLSLFVAAQLSAGGPIELSPNIDAGERFIWRSPAKSSVAALEGFWTRLAQSGEMRINAIRMAGSGDPSDISLVAMPIDAFTFAAAESPVRLEKVLRVKGTSDCPAGDPDDPRPDYEDDLENYNSAVLSRNGEDLAPAHYRIPQRMDAADRSPQREQFIPLIEGFPRDPADRSVELERAGEPIPSIPHCKIRDAIAEIYGLGPASLEFQVELEHTYGDRMEVGDAFRISKRFDWPVQLASSVEGEKVDGLDRPFVIASYDYTTEQVALTFDLSLLRGHFDPGGGPALAAFGTGQAAYSIAVAAWRSLAELAMDDMEVELVIESATFDLGESLSKSDPAGTLASWGFPGGISEAVATRPGLRKSETIGKNDPLRTFARNLLTGVEEPDDDRRVFYFTLKGGSALGDEAHVSRIDLKVRRAEAHARPDVQTLLPLSQQPGLFRYIDETLLGNWARLGFGPDVPPLPNQLTGPVAEQLKSQHGAWIDRIREGRQPFRSDTGEDDAVAGALVASLDGTGWFVPDGPGPGGKAQSVDALLLPLGFVPTMPFGGLGNGTEPSLQRLAVAFGDAIDLSYRSWATDETMDWLARFAEVAALAEPNGDNGWKGNLFDFVRILVEKLLFPQPADDPLNDGSIVALANAVRSSSGDLASLRRAVIVRLLKNPALFADSKAILLTALRFVDARTPGRTPPSVSLARARFDRVIRPEGNVGEGPESPSDPSSQRVSSVLTIDNLQLTGPLGEKDWDSRFGFLEMLDDARYDNAFIAAADGRFWPESFEDVVDPPDETDDPRLASRWLPGKLVVPLAADATAGIVRLASRSPVAPPVLVWSGPAPSLRVSLRKDSKWSLDHLLERQAGQGAGAILEIIGKRLEQHDFYADTGQIFALYRIEGDEETTSLAEALENDGLFLRLSEADAGPPLLPEDDREPGNGGKTIDREKLQAAELNLSLLLKSARGTSEAAAALCDLALASGDFTDLMGQIVRSSSAALPANDFLLLRPSQSLEPRVHNTAPPTDRKILDLALFAQKDAGPAEARTGYLLCSFETEVWSRRRLEILHGRNLDYSDWNGSINGLPDAVFGKEFWQAAPQASRPSQYTLARHFENIPEDWGESERTSELDDSWRPSRSAKELIELMLRTSGKTIRGLEGAPAILSPASISKLLSHELNISIYHEQFEDDPATGAEPVGRIMLESRRITNIDAEFAFFDRDYDHFSVDFDWYSRSGVAVLQLRRLFAQF
ncbi:hypothetical protein SZ64_00695 [Erythrobacter sp. SG61-1L]|uniref:hypothetical protein n=1 Tax=Erythrobacter sp. SG61-1L TaxID=1603897 RepID=UPI0006C8F5D8|nr:hypothetical protein [Erythrobacter sp. SG61-1L]KPL66747.1 hypothetical protein SZ64_00695 [Erythrobacter sp. SG61-1L]